jgi:hypothetical protein
MYHKSKYFLSNAKIIFRIYLLSILFLPTSFLAQITQESQSEIYISGDAIVFDQNSENFKIPIYITSGASIYSEENIPNGEIIVLPEKLDEIISPKRKELIVKKKLQKSFEKQRNFEESNVKVKIKVVSGHHNYINSVSSVLNGMIIPSNYFHKFIICNPESKTNFSIFQNKDVEVFYQNFAFSGSFHFYVYVRPPPALT